MSHEKNSSNLPADTEGLKIVEPIELPRGADASLGLLPGERIVEDPSGNRRVVRELGKRADELPTLLY